MPHDRAQIVTELELGIRYLQYRCPPLKGFGYEILWREHELGAYANVCLVWEDEFREPPWHLIEDAQRALQTFDEALDWSAIWQVDDGEEEDSEEETVAEAEDENNGTIRAVDDLSRSERQRAPTRLLPCNNEDHSASPISEKIPVMEAQSATQIEALQEHAEASKEDGLEPHHEPEHRDALRWELVEAAVRLAFDIWMGQPEPVWVKQAFDFLVLSGLVENTDAFSRHQAIFRVIVLGGIYRDFCEAAWDQTSWIDYEEWCEPPELVDRFVVGQLFAWTPDWNADEEVEFYVALDRLVEAERETVVGALLKGFGGGPGLYASLWHSTQPPDPKHFGDLEEVFEEKDSIEPNDAGKQKAYEWVSDGCPRRADLAASRKAARKSKLSREATMTLGNVSPELAWLQITHSVCRTMEDYRQAAEELVRLAELPEKNLEDLVTCLVTKSCFPDPVRTINHLVESNPEMSLRDIDHLPVLQPLKAVLRMLATNEAYS